MLFRSAYRTQFKDSGYRISGTSPDGRLVELVELVDHPFFTACQYHPEFLSRPGKPHPLFRGLIEAAQRRRQGSEAQQPGDQQAAGQAVAVEMPLRG